MVTSIFPSSSPSLSLSPVEINPPQNLLQIYRSQIRLMVSVCIINVIGLILWLFLFVANGQQGIATAGDATRLKLIALIAIHLGLHWLSGKIERRLRLAIIYLFVQFILLIYAGYLIHYPILILFLVPLLAEIVVVFEALWLIPVAIVVCGLAQIIISLINALDVPYPPPSVMLPLIWPGVLLGLFLSFWAYLPSCAAYFLVIRSRRQTGSLLITLDTAHRQLASYAEQVEQLTLTAERARLARELHDTLAQGIVGVVLQLEALDSQVAQGDNARVAAVLTQIKQQARATLKGSRLAIDDLRLPLNQPSMILQSIGEEVNKFSALTNVPCRLVTPPSLTLPTSTTEHIIRFVGESLANIAKHARSSQVTVRMALQDQEIVLEVQDDGVGFDLAAGARKVGHYGLIGLQERARLVGGTFEINSAPGKGTTVRLYLPVLN